MMYRFLSSSWSCMMRGHEVVEEEEGVSARVSKTLGVGVVVVVVVVVGVALLLLVVVVVVV